MLFNVGKFIVSSYVAISINNWMQDVFATDVGLCQLCTKHFCMQLTKAYVAEMSCNQLLIDTAT